MSAGTPSVAHLSLKGPTKETATAQTMENSLTRAVWIEPVSSAEVQGVLEEWTRLSGEKRVKVPGYWYGTDRWLSEKARQGEVVLLAFHGGGYAMGSAHSSDFTSSVIQGVLDACLSRETNSPGASTLPTRALSVEYRLSSAANLSSILCDALAGYLHLVDRCGFSPERIVLVGDSAGGHLALMLTRYLRDTGLRQMPRALILASPWCDLSMSWYFDGKWAKVNSRIDFLSDGLVTPRDQVVRRMPRSSLQGSYISPVTAAKSRINVDEKLFATFPPAFVILGGRERFRDEIQDFVRVYGSSAGEGSVRLYTEPEGAHDFLALRKLGLFQEEYARTTKAVSEWLRETVS
ncbi:hypothetical protein ACM66B_006096 [Microbotryomycetes sp. NB124-2]